MKCVMRSGGCEWGVRNAECGVGSGKRCELRNWKSALGMMKGIFESALRRNRL
jgi:hypothetical protein